MSTTEPTQQTNGGFQKKALQVWQYIKHMSITAVALLFIINSVAIGLYAFGFVHPSPKLAAVFGAVSMAFATVVLGALVHSGVQHQTTNKKRR